MKTEKMAEKSTGGRVMAQAFGVGRWALLLSTLTLLAWSLPLNAKEKEMMECTLKNGHVVDRTGRPLENCMFVSGGKTYMLVNGKGMLMTKPMTMADGTQCRPDGTCILKNGKTIKLREGQGIETMADRVFRVKGLVPPGYFSKP